MSPVPFLHTPSLLISETFYITKLSQSNFSQYLLYTMDILFGIPLNTVSSARFSIVVLLKNMDGTVNIFPIHIPAHQYPVLFAGGINKYAVYHSAIFWFLDCVQNVACAQFCPNILFIFFFFPWQYTAAHKAHQLTAQFYQVWHSLTACGDMRCWTTTGKVKNATYAAASPLEPASAGKLAGW